MDVPPRRKPALPLHLASVLGTLLLLGVAACGPDPVGLPGQEALGQQAAALTLEEGLDVEERAFFAALNTYREQNGLAKLQVSVALTRASEFHANDMVADNYFSHDTMDRNASGGLVVVEGFGTRINRFYAYNTVKAENLAAGSSTGQAAFTQWKNSSGHNANMLGSSYRVVGIARAYGASTTYGWYWNTTFGGFVDEVMTEAPPNAPPSVATPASASPSVVTGTSTSLSALGADDGGEPALVYTWSMKSGPASVSFSPNGSHAARDPQASFGRSGAYVLEVAIRDAAGLTVRSEVAVTVSQTATSLVLTPSSASVRVRETQRFTVAARDQFTQAMTPGGAPSWSATGGVVDTSGLFTAGTVAGAGHVVRVAWAGLQAEANVTVMPNDAPTVASPPAASPLPLTGTTGALSVLGADDRGEAALVYTWACVTCPRPVSFSPNGSNAAKSTTVQLAAAGEHVLQVRIEDAEGGAVTAELVLEVLATPTSLSVTPNEVQVALGDSFSFQASFLDQFGDPHDAAEATWTISGGGSVSAGTILAQSVGGPFVVTATHSGLSAEASLHVLPAGSVVDPPDPRVDVAEPEGPTAVGEPAAVDDTEPTFDDPGELDRSQGVSGQALGCTASDTGGGPGALGLLAALLVALRRGRRRAPSPAANPFQGPRL